MLGEEEHKLGIRASSTRQVFFNDTLVPVENMLSVRGGGFKIAVNALNVGRIKLGAACIDSERRAITAAIQYANDRKQFNTPIAQFGAIKHKIAEQAIRAFTLESAMYRAGARISEMEEQLRADGVPFSDALLQAAEAYSVECAVLKVAGSEMLDYVVDEGVQIHGGYGFSSEYDIERCYRDSRINRIFEGTNEICRMLAVGMMLKKAMKGELDLMMPAMAVQKELMGIPDMSSGDDSLFYDQYKAIENFKKAGLMVAGAAVQKYMDKIDREQMLMMNMADMLIELYNAESVLLRVDKLVQKDGEAANAVAIDMAKIYINNAADIINRAGKEAINAFAEGDMSRMLLLGLKRFTKQKPYNAIAARDRVAVYVSAAKKYPF